MRYLYATGLAFFFASGLFWLMHLLIVGSDDPLDKNEGYKTVDFVRLTPQEDLQTRERSKPEPPPPPDEPPPPPDLMVQQTQTTQAQQQSPVPFEMPRLDIPTNMAGGPMLGEMAGSVAPGGSAELIPLVRLTPQYPQQAARAKISGWVKLRITVNPDGTVRNARAIDSDPRGLFEEAAVVAARRGKFRPRIQDGVAVESEGEYTVNFKMGE